MLAITAGSTLLSLLAFPVNGSDMSSWSPPEPWGISLEAVAQSLDFSLFAQLQAPPRSVSQTQVRVPTTGGTGSSFRDSRPLFGSQTNSAARSQNQLPRAASPPPLITSRQVASRAVNRSVFGNAWGW